MRLRVFFACMLTGIALFFAAGARAESASQPKLKVLVVHSSLPKPAVRISAELSSLGYDAQIIEAQPPISNRALYDLCRENGADAVMRVSPEGNSVQVLVIGGADEARAVIEEVSVPEDAESAEALLAFKAVELLRAGFLKLPEAKKKRPAPESTPPVESPPPAAATPSPPPTAKLPKKDGPPFVRLAAALEPAALFTFGGLPPGFDVGLFLFIRIAPRLFLDIGGLIPTFPMSASTEGGRAEVLASTVTAGFRVNLVPSNFRWTPSIAVTAGPMFIKAQSRPDADYTGALLRETTAVVNGTAALSFAVNKRLYLKADVSGGAAVKKVTFAVSDVPAVSLGHPLLSVLFGIAVRLL